MPDTMVNATQSRLGDARGDTPATCQEQVRLLSLVIEKNRLKWESLKKKETCLKHAATAKSLQSCPTLCDPIDGSPPGSPIPGILQARTLEWVAISFSNA